MLIRDNEAISILSKVTTGHAGGWLDAKVSRQKPFGFRTNFTDFSKEPFDGATKIYANGGTGWLETARVPDENGWVGKWKVLISRACGAGETIPHQITGMPIVAEPNSCCTETYIFVGSFDNEKMVQSMAAFMKTRFVRFLISLKKNTQDVTRSKFSFVPDLAMDRAWTDEALFEAFGVAETE